MTEKDFYNESISTETNIERPILMVSDTCGTISVDKAEDISFKIMQPVLTKSGIPSITIDSINDTNGNTLAYVFNYGVNEGFTIISSTRNFHPVLAFSESGHFSIESSNNPGLNEWTESLRIKNSTSCLTDSAYQTINLEWNELLKTEKTHSMETRSFSPEAEEAAIAAVKEWNNMGYTVWSVDDVDPSILPFEMKEEVDAIRNDHNSGGYSYGPCFILEKHDSYLHWTPSLIKTEWEQGYPYNSAHPLWKEDEYWEYVFSNGERGSTGPNMGCVPLALSQIMFSFGQPSEKFDFSKMPLKMSYHFENDYLPEFIKKIGQDCGIDYTKGQTSSTLDKAKNTFIKYGYTVNKVGFNSKAITTSIDLGSPVLMGGSGHAWVCEGYHLSSTHYHFELMVYTGDFLDINPLYAFCSHHKETVQSSALSYLMNWGWEQSCNGYYSGDSWNVPNYGTFKNPDCLVNIKFLNSDN